MPTISAEVVGMRPYVDVSRLPCLSFWCSGPGIPRTHVMDLESPGGLCQLVLHLTPGPSAAWGQTGPASQALGHSPALSSAHRGSALGLFWLSPPYMNRTAVGYHTFLAPVHLLQNKGLQEFSAVL